MEVQDNKSSGEIFLDNNYRYDRSVLPVIDQIVLDFMENGYSFEVNDNISIILKVCRQKNIAIDDFFKRATGSDYTPQSMDAFERHLGEFIKQRYAANA